jgi:predicted GIY-YIG superfamily endonuclease
MDWCCYILRSEDEEHKNSTYNGRTNNIEQRIRRHNGYISGGARATQRYRPWKIYCLITGFADKIEAMQAEWKIRTVHGRRRPGKYNGVIGRIKGLNEIMKLEKFTSNSTRKISEMDLKIFVEKEYLQYLDSSIKNVNVL